MLKTKLITIILGTRPEAIKLAPLIIAFRKNNNFITRVVFTGQHQDMVEQVMNIFQINYDLNLNVMKHNQSISQITNSVLDGLEKEFIKFKPSLVIVQGDTSTAFSAALAAFYQKIPVGHVEAGLRTNNLFNPFPEEANRRLISQLTTLHFAPTKLAKQNLIDSSLVGEIFITGNTVIDALMMVSKKELKLPTKNIDWYLNDVIFATLHRRENWGENIISISKSFLKILDELPNAALVIPLHPNKKVRDPIKKILDRHNRVELIEPLDYQQSVSCMKKAKVILTDSGGIQEEAPSLSKPVLVLRDSTERIEAVEAGTAKIIGTNSENVIKETIKLMTDENLYNSMVKTLNPYGDGKASERIIEICENFFK